MGFLFGSGKKAAKIQAEATMRSAEMQAKADREVARGNVLAMASQAAMRQAADRAAEALRTPQQNVEVVLAPEEESAEIDEKTGRRKTVRSQFFSQPSSGLNI